MAAMLLPAGMVAAVLSISMISFSLAMEVQDSKVNNPVAKVVGMMEDMQTELKKEFENEKDLFEKAMCFCDNGEGSLKKSVQKSSDDIDRLSTKIEADTAERKKLMEELKQHKAEKAQTEKSLYEATKVRETEAKKFQDDFLNNKFAMDSIEQALRLFGEKGSVAAFVQANPASKTFRRIIEVSHFISPTNKEKVFEFLDDGAESAAEPSAGMGEIFGILKGMQDEMAANNKDMKHEEHDASESFKEMKGIQLQRLGTLGDTIADKDKRVGDLRLSIAQDQDELNAAKTEYKTSSRFLANLDEECAKKKEQKDIRLKSKLDEIAAVGEAMEILTNDEAKDAMFMAGEKHAKPTAALIKKLSETQQVPRHPSASKQMNEMIKDFRTSLLQVHQDVVPRPHKVSLVQSSQPISIPKIERTEEEKQNVAALKAEMEAANKVDARAERRAKAGDQGASEVVHFMVQNMVEVLHDDDVNDEHKKDFCVNETESYHDLQDEKQRFVEKLGATIEENTAELKQTIADIKSLEQEIYDLDQDVAKFTLQRKAEHVDYKDTHTKTATAVALIDKAAKRLSDFYNPAEQKMREEGKFALSFLSKRQSSAAAPPPMVDTPTGDNKNKGGNKIISMLNEIKSELNLDLKECDTEEKYSQKDYVRLMEDAQEDRAAAVKALHEARSKKAQLETQLEMDKETMRLTLEELEDIGNYLIQLHESCDFLMKNYDNRHGARVDEEVGLESAETIVTHEEPPSHTDTAEQFEEEHSKKQVDEHFPDAPMPKV